MRGLSDRAFSYAAGVTPVTTAIQMGFLRGKGLDDLFLVAG